jgi:hypothetical protein
MKKNYINHRFLVAFIALIMVPLLAGPGCYLLDDGTYGKTTEDLNVLTMASGARVDLVGEWLFTGNANDTSGNENHGTVYGATLVPDKAGYANRAYSFNGISSYIDCGAGSSLNIPSSVTVTAWIKTTMSGSGAIMLKGGDYINYTPYYLGISSGKVYVLINSLTGGVMSSPTGTAIINDGLWHSVAMTADDSSRKLSIYVDGSLDKQINFSFDLIFQNAPAHGRIGVMDIDNNINWFSGVIDDVRIYSGALSAKEIKAVATGGLVGEWPFNGNAYDTSGSRNHGIVSGASLCANRFGDSNSAYTFTSGTSITSSTTTNLPLGGAKRTFSMWFRLSSLPSTEYTPIASYGQGNYDELYEAGIYNDLSGTWSIYFGNGQYIWYRNFSFLTGHWYHLVVTSSGGSWQIYLDGAPYTYGSGHKINTAAGGVYIGRYPWPASTEYFPGAIDDLRIYNWQMTDGEVLNLFHENGW